MGQIENYCKDESIAIVSLDNGYLYKNDDILIMGVNTDTYIHQSAEFIKYKGKFLDRSPRGTKANKIFIELKIIDSAIGNGKDKLYIFTDKTYKKQSYSL